MTLRIYSEKYNESSRFAAGKKRKSFQLPRKIWFEHMLRYQISHLYRDLSKRGAQILTVPSAFTVPTGKAHWEILCARAIENGAFVIAPAQTGTHNFSNGGDRKTYGHSMAVDPWGTVLVNATSV